MGVSEWKTNRLGVEGNVKTQKIVAEFNDVVNSILEYRTLSSYTQTKRF